MKIEKVFCRELRRTIDIQEAGISYFAQTPPRNKYSFYCSSPECEALPAKVEVLGVNYHRVPIQADESTQITVVQTSEEDSRNKPRASPYFRTKQGEHHSIDCQWVIDEEAEHEYVSEAETTHEQSIRRKRIAAEGLIEETSFLLEKQGSDATQTDGITPAKVSTKETRRRRIDRAKTRIKQARRSPYFSALVSSYVKVLENQLYHEPLNVIGIGDTTWGSFFYPLNWYTPENHRNHIFEGNVRITTLPRNHDWLKGDPYAVILTFYKEVTVGETRAQPSIKLLKREVEARPGSYVLFEAVKSARQNDNYKSYLRCYFYGSIEEAIEKGKNQTNNSADSDKVLNVKPLRLDTLELRRIDV